MSSDFVSIIVPTLDGREQVQEHLARIAAADAGKIELILVCSPRAAMEEADLKPYGFRSSRVVRGRDVSQPDAIELGARLAAGSLITWLNPGDAIRVDTISRVRRALAENPGAGIVYGRAQLRVGEASAGEYPVAPVISPESLFQACCISQPAAWISRSAWSSLGGVRSLFDCAFDYDLWIRAAQSGVKFVFLDEILADVDVSPDSKTFSRRADVFQEQCELLMHHYGRCPPSALTAIWAEALTPAEGYSSIAADLLRQAGESLKSIARTSVKLGDFQTARRLQNDARLHFLSQGVAVEAGRNGYLSQSSRIRISADRLPINLLFQLDRLPDSLEDVAILSQPDLEPARCTLLGSTGCMAARIEPSAAAIDEGFATLTFLTTSDLGARLINAW